MPLDSISMCSNNFYMCNVEAGSSLRWLSASTMTLCNRFWLHTRPWTPKSDPSSVGITVWGYCHMPMESISICSNTLYLSNVDAWEAVEVAVSFNHDVMTSFWLHKWPRTPKYEPSSVGITVWGNCCMSMDSISMCSNNLYMSNVEAGSSLRWLSASTMT